MTLHGARGDISESARVKVQARYLKFAAFVRKLQKMNNFLFPSHSPTLPSLRRRVGGTVRGNVVTWLAHICCFLWGAVAPVLKACLALYCCEG